MKVIAFNPDTAYQLAANICNSNVAEGLASLQQQTETPLPYYLLEQLAVQEVIFLCSPSSKVTFIQSNSNLRYQLEQGNIDLQGLSTETIPSLEEFNEVFKQYLTSNGAYVSITTNLAEDTTSYECTRTQSLGINYLLGIVNSFLGELNIPSNDIPGLLETLVIEDPQMIPNHQRLTIILDLTQDNLLRNVSPEPWLILANLEENIDPAHSRLLDIINLSNNQIFINEYINPLSPTPTSQPLNYLIDKLLNNPKTTIIPEEHSCSLNYNQLQELNDTYQSKRSMFMYNHRKSISKNKSSQRLSNIENRAITNLRNSDLFLERLLHEKMLEDNTPILKLQNKIKNGNFRRTEVYNQMVQSFNLEEVVNSLKENFATEMQPLCEIEEEVDGYKFQLGDEYLTKSIQTILLRVPYLCSVILDSMKEDLVDLMDNCEEAELNQQLRDMITANNHS